MSVLSNAYLISLTKKEKSTETKLVLPSRERLQIWKGKTLA